jgi:hypothetical protein
LDNFKILKQDNQDLTNKNFEYQGKVSEMNEEIIQLTDLIQNKYQTIEIELLKENEKCSKLEKELSEKNKKIFIIEEKLKQKLKYMKAEIANLNDESEGVKFRLEQKIQKLKIKNEEISYNNVQLNNRVKNLNDALNLNNNSNERGVLIKDTISPNRSPLRKDKRQNYNYHQNSINDNCTGYTNRSLINENYNEKEQIGVIQNLKSTLSNLDKKLNSNQSRK